jgi:hypothetical protein
MKKPSKLALGTLSAAVMLSAATFGAGTAGANGGGKAQPVDAPGRVKTVTLTAELTPLNDSGAYGTATAVIRKQNIRSIKVQAHGVSPDAPHAQHIHYGDDARNECPTLFDDVDGDELINTVEGVPAYGPVVVSLTTEGDTSPESVLAVARYPVSSNGAYSYFRKNIKFTDVAGTGYTGGNGTAKQIADSVRAGEGVVVIHGVDYNGNGVYDGEEMSELDPSLPREATDPAACGILR